MSDSDAAKQDESSSSGGGDTSSSPLVKKLRYSQPDVKVILVYTNDDQEKADDSDNNKNKDTAASDACTSEESKKEKEYWMYSLELCRWSKFVDNCLSSNMQEASTKEIKFHNVTPEIFDLAIRLQNDHNAIRSATAEEAIKVVEFYDKYEFTAGLEFCDRVIVEHFKNLEHQGGEGAGWLFSDLDLSIESTVVAERHNLKESKTQSLSHMYSCLFGEPSIFTVDQVKKLHHLFKEGNFPDVVPDQTSKEELESACFPKYFVSYHSNRGRHHSILVRAVRISLTETDADGTYYRDDDLDSEDSTAAFLEKPGGRNMFQGQRGKFWVGRSDDSNWSICFAVHGDDGIVEQLWVSPNSGHLDIPPTSLWLPVEGSGLDFNSTPVLEYV